MIDKTEKSVDRRRNNSDIIMKIIHWLALSVWLLMFVVFIITDRARPESPTFFDRYANSLLRSNWDIKLMRYVLLLLIIVFLLSVIGFCLNTQRRRRKNDRYNLSLIIMGSLSLIGIVLWIYYFLI